MSEKKYHYLGMKQHGKQFHVSLVSEMIDASELLAIFYNEEDAHQYIGLKIKELGVEHRSTVTFKFVAEEKKDARKR